MDIINNLPPLGIDIVVLLLVIAIKSLITHLSSNTGLSFFHFYCQQLAGKVNKPNNSNQQRKIAGFIACLITIVPVMIILWLFESYVELNIIWHALLLYLSLGSFGHVKAAKNISLSSQKQLKDQARQQLAPWVLRDVKQLTFLGMHKACIEMLQSRFLQHQFAIAFYFLLLGPYFALSARILIDMHHCWNLKLKTFQPFGLFANWCTQWLLWLPTRLYTTVLFLVNITRPRISKMTSFSTVIFSINNNLALAALASILNVKLGGVAMYEGEKQRAIEFNGNARMPNTDDINHAIGQLNLVKTLALGSLICIVVVLAIIPTR